MKNLVFLSLFLLFISCQKKEGILQAPTTVGDSLNLTAINICKLSESSKVSYTAVAKKIFADHCNQCHAKPGSGGINLDNYDDCKATALSGQIMPVVVFSPGNIFMPPSPNKALDSCEIKALNLWIKQGCLLN